MSIVSIPNQPILFNQSDNCTNYGINQDGQLVDFNDEIFFQIGLDCGGSQITNQTSERTIWTFNGVLICNDGTSGGSFVSTIQPEEVYEVFEVNVIVPILNGGSLNVQFQGGQTETITAAGTYTFYFNSTIMLTDPTPTITYSGDDFDGCFVVGNFQFAFIRGLYSNHRFFVIDSNDNVVIDEPDYIQKVENTVTYGFDFDLHDIESGCYRIGYADECDNTCGQFRIDNGTFAYVGGWTFTNGATIDDDLMQLTLPQTGLAAPSVTNDKALCENKVYYIEFEIESITGGTLVASVGNSLSTGSPIQGSSPGVYSGTAFSTSGTGFLLRLSGSNTDVAVINYVIVRFADSQAPEINGESNLLSVGDYSGCEYVKLEGCNGNNSFNFKFEGSGFVPGIRVLKRFFRPQYVTDIETYRDAEGINKTSFADIEKVKTLRIEQQPEYVFDFLSILAYFDNFYVNGITYVLNETDFPSIEWDDANENGNINLDLKLKNGLVRKVNCNDVDANCLPTVFGGDENNFLLQNEDRFVLQNGDDFDLQE